MSGGRVRVVVRPRPSEGPTGSQDAPALGRKGLVAVRPEESKVQVRVRVDPRHANGKAEPQEQVWDFRFDQVLPQECSQRQVFDACMDDLLRDALQGFNGTVMAYGQTGAGKTHTMTGKPRSAGERGLASRTLSQLFRAIEAAGDESTYSVRLSYLEIYNEQLFDLLEASEGRKALGSALRMAADESGSVCLGGLSRRAVRNEEEAFACLFEAETNRVIASHELNYSSTRSHCILTVHVEGRHKRHNESVGTVVETVSTAKLNLVDLAGSERIFKTNSTGSVLREAKAINKSLSFLEQVVVALADKKREHIPYRQSLLTHYLQDSLGGNCKALLVACIWPIEAHTEQTLATLKFATRMMRVKNAPVRNDRDSGCDSLLLREYKREVQQLRAELALRDDFLRLENPDVDPDPLALVHRPYAPAQLDAIRTTVELFVDSGELRHVKAQSARHLNAMLSLLRDQVLAARRQAAALEQQERQRQQERQQHRQRQRQEGRRPETEPRRASGNDDDDDDDDDENNNNNNNGGSSSSSSSNSGPGESERPQTPPEEGEQQDDRSQAPETQDREKLFEMFKRMEGGGAESCANIAEAKKTLLEFKQRSKALKARINESKAQIDDAVAALEAQPQDEAVLIALKEHKRSYRQGMELLRELKSESAFAAGALKSCREQLASGFEAWLAARPKAGRHDM